MEIKNLDAKQVAECIEKYQPTYEKNVKRNRWKVVFIFVGLLLVYLYLRLFNTAASIEDEYGKRSIYSTAWVVNYRPSFGGESYYWLRMENCPYMRVLNVEEGVVSFDLEGESVYRYANDLHKVKLPSTLMEIRHRCFEDCINLKTVEWEQAPSGACIRREAFKNTGIEEFCVPEGVACIESGAFEDNSELKKVVLSDSVCKIGTDVFANCAELQEVTWSASLKCMPGRTFLGCENLSVLNHTESLKYIDYDALIGTCILANQLPANVYCYGMNDGGVTINTDDIPWLAGYKYVYDAQGEIASLSEMCDISSEVFRQKPADGRFWLDGKYYGLDMTLDEFVANGDWTIDEIYENEGNSSTYCLERESDTAEITLIVVGKEIVEYEFDSDECKVILPDGVSNFGMPSARISYLYGEDATAGYVWEYNAGSENGQVYVTAYYGWSSESYGMSGVITISKVKEDGDL